MLVGTAANLSLLLLPLLGEHEVLFSTFRGNGLVLLLLFRANVSPHGPNHFGEILETNLSMPLATIA